MYCKRDPFADIYKQKRLITYKQKRPVMRLWYIVKRRGVQRQATANDTAPYLAQQSRARAQVCG